MTPDDHTAPPTAEIDVKEKQILEAAFRAFMEFGYAATSMDEVARSARASKTTLYSRFPSKEALFAAAIACECKRRVPTEGAEITGLPVEEGLRRIGRAFVELIWSPEAVRIERIITGEAGNFPEVAEMFYRSGPLRLTNAIAQYLAEAAARGEVAVDDPVFAAGHFLMALKGKAHCDLTFGQKAPPPPEQRDALVAKAVALFLNGARPR
jgi:TetR/AcrR family transcriptional regulator, mexJK operon transcriptional repressor